MKEVYPTLSLQERDRRWRLTRELIKTKGLDCLIVAGLNGREQFEGYLSNDYVQGVVVFPLEGKPTYLAWSETEVMRYVESCLGGETVWIDDWKIAVLTGAGLVEILQEKGFDSATIGVVGLDSKAPGESEGYIPYRTWAYVLEHLPKATFIDISQSFAEMALVKSEEEVAMVRHSAHIGEMACEAMMEITRPEVSESEICAAVMKTIIANGASARNLILHSGPDNPSWGPPIWFYQAQHPHLVQKGDMVQAQLFPCYGGFEAQQQMSVALGPVHPVNMECARVARRAYEVGLKTLRPGKKFQEVAEAMGVPIAEAGCWHLTPLIHSVGPFGWASQLRIGIEQLPEIENFKVMKTIRAMKPVPVLGGDLVIKPGMVFGLEPNACRGKHRVNIGGTVLVTESGVEELNKLPTEMRVVG